jgi:Family of unknown function (DUF6445)
MHETLINDVAGYLQEYKIRDDRINIVGWCFHKSEGVLPIRLNHDGRTDELIITETRRDVCDAFNNYEIENCGWIINIPQPELLDVFRLEMKIDNEWQTVFDFLFYDTSETYIPSFIVIDNFYKYPDKVREFALKQKFQEHPQYHKGKRTDTIYRFPNVKARFENILGYKITNWREHGVNCCFQSCIAGDQLVYHFDTQQYAGLLFLTPDAPPECGTTFYRSKVTKNMKLNDDFNIVFKTGLLDETQFDVVDVVGNRYNRLVLFDAQMIHAASAYFGNTITNGRLFQMFFFDLE